jgi:hypothetical protein
MKKYIVLTLLVCVVLIGTARITSAADSQAGISASSSITSVWDWVTSLFSDPVGYNRDKCVVTECNPCVNPESEECRNTKEK